MTKDYHKIIADYEMIFAGKDDDAIYSSDLNNVKDNNSNLYDLISNAMKYGYVLGFKDGLATPYPYPTTPLGAKRSRGRKGTI